MHETKRSAARFGARWATALAALGVAWLLATPETVSAQGSLFLRGARAYAEGRYADAATHFSDAYAADPDPTYLYHLGRALEGAGDAAGALAAYDTWLELAPDAPERAEVEASLARLRSEAAAPEPDAPIDAPREDETASTRPSAPASLVRRSEGRRLEPWPWVVLSGGALFFVAGAITAGVAVETHGAADRAPSHAETVAREGDAQAQAAAATALMVIGGAITLAGGAWGVVDLVMPRPGAAADEGATARLRLGPASARLELEF